MSTSSAPAMVKHAFRLLVLTLVAALGTVVLAVPARADAAASCPDGGYPGVPGQRIKTPTSPAIYMVDPEGRRRHILNQRTYEHFFRDWSGIITTPNAQCVYPGPDLEISFNFLARATPGTAVYFVESDGPVQEARWIPSVAVFDKYHFRWGAVVPVDQWWLYDRAGRNWT
jgi:hypothetical protein